MEKEVLQSGWIARIKSAQLDKNGEEYLPVKTPNGNVIHGGIQNWYYLRSKHEELERQGVKKRYQLCRRDENYRLASLGCGVIAMTNLETYLKRRMASKKESEGTKELTQKGYEAIIDEKWEKTYHIGSSYLNFKVGLYPWKMEEGLQNFLKSNGFDRQSVKWAPYCMTSPKKHKELVLKAIIEMLQADYPVVFAYHTFREKTDALIMYQSLESAIRQEPMRAGDDSVVSHYMTITGVYERSEKKYLQVESWGRIFYVSYDKYAKKLSYFSNILYIR